MSCGQAYRINSAPASAEYLMDDKGGGHPIPMGAE